MLLLHFYFFKNKDLRGKNGGQLKHNERKCTDSFDKNQALIFFPDQNNHKLLEQSQFKKGTIKLKTKKVDLLFRE